MKKMRILLMAVAIIAGIGGAVVANSQSTPTLYYKSSDGNFYPAGVENYDFVCEWAHFGTCTYTYNASSGYYQEYKSGKILWLR